MRTSVALILSVFLFPSWTGAQTASSTLGRRTLLPAHVLCTDLPVTAVPSQKVLVRSGHNSDGRLSLSPGDVAVLSGGAPQGLSTGQRFLVRRLNAMNRDGDGYGAVRTAGWLTVTAVDQQTALARIDFACDSIEPGDFLETFAEPALPEKSADMSEPRFSDRARVLFGADRRINLADGDIFSVDRGREQGVSPGDRLAIYRDPQNGSPLVHVADAVVLELSEKTSKAVLVMVRDAVHSGDLAFPRGSR
ncbi:MAG: hypothetical protein ACRD2N_05860 [Vicinamibacterales bacterium]